MARVVQILSDFIRWRWAPFVGLVGASLFYVLFAILLIPSNVGASENEEEEAPAVDAPESASDRGDERSETDAQTAAPSPVKHIERSSPLPAAPAPKRRGFSPPLERAEPAPPPPPTPPPPPAAVVEQVPPPQAPPAPDPAAGEQQRIGAAAAARAATLAATRASRLSGRGLRPRMPAEAAADAPVHEESEISTEDEEESEAPAEANAEQEDDSDGDDSERQPPAEAEPQEAGDE